MKTFTHHQVVKIVWSFVESDIEVYLKLKHCSFLDWRLFIY